MPLKQTNKPIKINNKKNKREKTMKKNIAIIVVMAMILMTSAITALAADKLLDVKITNVVEKNDKNGNPYMRLSFNVSKKLGNIDYNETQSIMVFSDKVDLIKKMGIKSGSQFKAVCSENEYKGRMGYILIAPDASSSIAAAPAQAAPAQVAAPIAPAAPAQGMTKN